jgi:uncharacterized protein YjiS (DUF1127 family)
MQITSPVARQEQAQENSPAMERAMSTLNAINLSVSISEPNSSTLWSRLMHRLSEWRRRVRSRDELMSLSDRTLGDIGLTRCEATHEASKPFWMP